MKLSGAEIMWECLVREGVVADAELADAGVIFGTGFAPYTGGPMNYSTSGEH